MNGNIQSRWERPNFDPLQNHTPKWIEIKFAQLIASAKYVSPPGLPPDWAAPSYINLTQTHICIMIKNNFNFTQYKTEQNSQTIQQRTRPPTRHAQSRLTHLTLLAGLYTCQRQLKIQMTSLKHSSVTICSQMSFSKLCLKTHLLSFCRYFDHISTRRYCDARCHAVCVCVHWATYITY